MQAWGPTLGQLFFEAGSFKKGKKFFIDTMCPGRWPKAGIYNGTRLWTGPRALSAGLGLAGALPLAPGHKTQVTVTVPMNCCGGGNLQAMQAHEAYLGARRWRSGRLGVAATCCEPGVAMVPRPAALPAARWSSVSVVSSCCRPSVPEVLHLKGAL